MKEKTQTHVYGVKEFVTLSIMNFEGNYLKTGNTK